jgi:hypothetical protein
LGPPNLDAFGMDNATFARGLPRRHIDNGFQFPGINFGNRCLRPRARVLAIWHISFADRLRLGGLE